MSNSSIMSVREMIDSCFGEPDVNIVNFKLMQTILYLLARQQRLLERKVAIDVGTVLVPRTSSLSITEVKLKANVVKKKKKLTKSGGGQTIKGASIKSKTDKTSSKSTTDETTTSTDKTLKPTTDKSLISKSTTKSSSKSTTDKTSTLISAAEPSASDKSTEKTTSKSKTESSEKTKSSSDKGESLSTRDDKDGSISAKTKKKDYHHLLELIEQQREQELRVVNQRADSREVAEKTPTPMASLDSMEAQYEKLLVVERVPIDEAEKKIGRLRDGKAPQLDIVTKQRFDELTHLVKEMQTKFGVVGTAEFPENMQLMEDLRRGASLTDAMAALQLSARLEAVEKTLKIMESLITNLAVKKGIKVKQKQDFKVPTYAVQLTQISVDTPETKVIYDAPSGLENTSRKFVRETDSPPTETEDPVIEMLEGLPKSNNINMDDLE